MEDLFEHFDQNADRFVDDLKSVLRIPSVSTDPARKADVRRCAEHVANHMRAIGIEHVEVAETKGHPVVLGDWLHAPGKPTALVYGHYDVQPPDPLDLWESKPFEPEIRNGNLYARGAVDDKGQFYMHLKAFEGFMKVRGKTPINLKFIVEGEEESGSDSLPDFLEANKQRLACNLIIVSDTAMLDRETPALTYGLRGMLYTQIEVTGPRRDLHSGHFGGAVANPGVALATIIAGLKNADGRITVPGFYDDVREMAASEREAMKAIPFDEKAFLTETGAPGPFGEKGYTTLERVSVRPTLDVNGMWGGYQGEGSKTVLPSFFAAKVSMRLVPDQEPNKLFEHFRKHVASLSPPGVTVNVRNLHIAQPFLTDPDSPVLAAARRALAKVWPKPPVMMREGGSVPVMADMQRVFGVPFVFMGFGLDDDQVHAPNEKFTLSCYHGGIKSVAALYEELASTK